jgi:hypothetical protein
VLVGPVFARSCPSTRCVPSRRWFVDNLVETSLFNVGVRSYVIVSRWYRARGADIRPEVLRRRATCRRGGRPSSFLIQPTCLPVSPGHGSDVVDLPKEAEEQRSVRLSDAAETSSSPRSS